MVMSPNLMFNQMFYQLPNWIIALVKHIKPNIWSILEFGT
jgi:hypothetical protein